MLVASVLQPVMDNWYDEMVPSQAYANSRCFSFIGLYQWLRIEPADNKHAGTEDIALAVLYLQTLHTWVLNNHMYAKKRRENKHLLLLHSQIEQEWRLQSYLEKLCWTYRL